MKFINRTITNSVSLIYGFKDEKPRYDLIATTHSYFNKTKIYGLLSRVSLSLEDFFELWKLLQKEVKTKYIQFEVIPSDAKVYKTFLEPVKVETVKTFNNFYCERITVLTKTKIRIRK